MIKVPAPDIDRVIQNVLLYADAKAMRLKEIFFAPVSEVVYVYSCDDYIALVDTFTLTEGTLTREFALPIEEVDKLGDWIKKDKKVVHKYDIILQPKFTGMLFECDETSPEDESDNFFVPEVIPNTESWDLVMELLSEENDLMPIPDFAIRPERLAKLARIKADKEAPIILRGININGHLVVQFKKGVTALGAIMPVDQKYVKEEFLWQTTEA